MPPPSVASSSWSSMMTDPADTPDAESSVICVVPLANPAVQLRMFEAGGLLPTAAPWMQMFDATPPQESGAAILRIVLSGPAPRNVTLSRPLNVTPLDRL